MEKWYFQKNLVLVKRSNARILARDVCMIDFIEFALFFKIETTIFVKGHLLSFKNLYESRFSTQTFTKNKDNFFIFDFLLYFVILLSLVDERIRAWSLNSNLFFVDLALHGSIVLAEDHMNFCFIIGIRGDCDGRKHLFLC